MSKTNKILFAISCLLVVISLLIAIQISFTAPQFEAMFKGFNAELPKSTINVLEYHYLGLIAPLLALFASIYLVKTKLEQTSKNIVYGLSVIAFVTTMSWQSYAVEAMYSPIMQMKTK